MFKKITFLQAARGLKCQILHKYSEQAVSVRVITIDGGQRFVVSEDALCQLGNDGYGPTAVLKVMIRDDPYGNFVPKGFVDAYVIGQTNVLRVKKDQIVSL